MSWTYASLLSNSSKPMKPDKMGEDPFPNVSAQEQFDHKFDMICLNGTEAERNRFLSTPFLPQQPQIIKGDEDIIKHLLLVQASSLSSLPFWYPFWKTATVGLEQYATRQTRPRIHWHLQTPRFIYSGLKLTAIMQPIYPITATMSYGFKKQLKCSELQAQIVSGILTAPICSFWKTKILCPTTKLSLSSLRGQELWAARNAILVPCILNGQYHTFQLLGENFRLNHPMVANLMYMLIPGSIATIMSHPMDLLTSLLNSDPLHQKYKNSKHACQMIWQQRGISGITIGLLPRFLALTIECNLFAAFYRFYQK